MNERELIAWVVLAVAAVGWVVLLAVAKRRKPARGPIQVLPSPTRPARDRAAEHDTRAVAPAPDLFPGVPDTHVLTDPPMVAAPGGPEPLRDWLKHFAGVDAWPVAVSRFYARAAADPAIAGYFAGVEMARLAG